VEAKEPEVCPEDCATPTPETAITVEVTEAATEAPTPTEAIEGRASTTTASGEFAFIGDPATVSQEGAAEAEQTQSNVAFILDGSGSMGESLPGSGQTKLAVAKEVMAELIRQIPAELNGTLWIYAHRYPPEPKAESCEDIEQVFALGPVDAGAYVDAIQGIRANGWTPIADSIVAAAGGLLPGDFNSIILVSDGEETCGGNPCAVAEALKGSEVELTVHVVGYAVDDATREQLECIARVSGGSYHDAKDAEGLLQALKEAMAATVVETVLRVEVVDPVGTELSEGFRLHEPGTDRVVSFYGAWKDNLVAPGSFDLLVFTLPELLYPDLTLPEGSTTVVRIVLGSIGVVTPEGEYLAADYYEVGTGERLGAYGAEGPVPLVSGAYYVEVNQSTSAPIFLGAGEAEEVVLGGILVLTPEGEIEAADIWEATTNDRLGSYGYDGPALLVPGSYYVKMNQSASTPISLEAGEIRELVLGAVRVLSPEGELTTADFWDATTNGRLGFYGQGEAVLLVPGSYYVKMHNTTTGPFAVESGQTTEVLLGAVRVDGGFALYEDDTYLGSYGDTLLLAPGTYRLELADGSVAEQVVVVAGEVTEVP
jgi:Mg-chelatase subunit ChlD